MKHRNSYGRQLFLRKAGLMALCVLLAVFMAVFLIWNAQAEARETEELERLNESLEQDSGKKQASDGKKTKETAKEKENVKQEKEEKAEKGEKEEAAEETPAETAAGIALWGIDFLMGAGTEQSGVAPSLQALLAQSGYSTAVESRLLASQSSLSVLKYAGVPDEEIQAYVNAHLEAGAQAGTIETSVREFTPEELADRGDPSFLPVLLMGYYGGWNGNIAELVQQEQKVLAALGKEEGPYLIAGLSAYGSAEEKAVYDEAMADAFGERYLSLAGLQNAPETLEGQAEIAAAVFQKLTEMGVLSKGGA